MKYDTKEGKENIILGFIIFLLLVVICALLYINGYINIDRDNNMDINTVMNFDGGTDSLSIELENLIPFVTTNNKEYIIPRYEEIRVEYQTPMGSIEDNTFKGSASQVFQQMNDLIEGITLDTLGLEVLDGYDEANEETKKLIIEMWMNSLKEKENQLKEEIKNDKELGQLNGAISFLKEVELGNVKLEKLTESEIEEVVAKNKQSENKTDENI